MPKVKTYKYYELDTGQGFPSNKKLDFYVHSFWKYDRRRHLDHNCLVFLQDPVDKYIDEHLGLLNLINFD